MKTEIETATGIVTVTEIAIEIEIDKEIGKEAVLVMTTGDFLRDIVMGIAGIIETVLVAGDMTLTIEGGREDGTVIHGEEVLLVVMDTVHRLTNRISTLSRHKRNVSGLKSVVENDLLENLFLMYPPPLSNWL